MSWADIPLKERVLHRIVPEPMSGCWLWDGSCDGQGYGEVRDGGVTFKAHRVVFEIFVGPIPEGMQLDHLCRNHACVNPFSHLEPVTPSVNFLRGEHAHAVAHNRGRCVAGLHDLAPGSTQCVPCQRAAQRRWAQEQAVLA